METIGENIVRLQDVLNFPMVPPPQWARKWQTESEHVLHLAHVAKGANDLDRLRELDMEAKRLVGEREDKLAKKKK